MRSYPLKLPPIETGTGKGEAMNVEQSGKPIVRVLRLRQVQERLGLGRSTIYDRMSPRSPRYDSTFPKPIKLGGSAVGWIESDICHWIDSRVAIGWGNIRDVESRLSLGPLAVVEEIAVREGQ